MTRALVAFSLAACRDDGPGGRPVDGPPVPTDVGSTSEPEARSRLTPDQLLTRLSLDLRGIRPTVEELEAFDGEPELLEAAIERYLHDPHLRERSTDLFAELVPIRLASFYVLLEQAYGDRFSIPELQATVAAEPLEMFAHVVENDLPYTDLVTGNWTVSNELLAEIFPVDWPEGQTGWHRTTYTDGRPGAGILSSNGLWWFKGQNLNNQQRVRANLVSRVLLCDDYLERELPFTEADLLTSEEAALDAVRTDPACTVCHHTLDPLAAHFWGFFYGDDRGTPEVIERYHPELEEMWQGGPPPGFFGQPSEGLGSLGRLIVEDERFWTCFPRRAWTSFVREDAETLGVDLAEIEAVFRDSGGNVREVVRAIVHHPVYQGYDERLGLRQMPTTMVSSMVEDLTGYRWTQESVDMLDSGFGYGTVGGLGDGVGSEAQVLTVGSTFVLEALAQAASRFVVEQDQLRGGAERRLFSPSFDFAATTEDEAGAGRVRAEIRHLLFRVLGRDLPDDDPEIEAVVELWSAAWATSGGDRTGTWSAVVAALLRHPDLVVY